MLAWQVSERAAGIRKRTRQRRLLLGSNMMR